MWGLHADQGTWASGAGASGRDRVSPGLSQSQPGLRDAGCDRGSCHPAVPPLPSPTTQQMACGHPGPDKGAMRQWGPEAPPHCPLACLYTEGFLTVLLFCFSSSCSAGGQVGTAGRRGPLCSRGVAGRGPAKPQFRKNRAAHQGHMYH